MGEFIDIASLEGDNLGGLFNFVFAPFEDIEEIPTDNNYRVLDQVVFKEGKNWYKSSATIDTIRFTEKNKKTEQGDIILPQLEAFIAKDGLDRIRLFDKMCRHRFIVLYQDNNGLAKIVGSLKAPLAFSCDLDTRDKITGRNGHAITFFGESRHKAFTYPFSFDFNDDFNNDFTI